MGEIKMITISIVMMMEPITIMIAFFNLVFASFIFHLSEVGRRCPGKLQFQQILKPTASGEVDKPKERYLLHGTLCNAGTTIPVIAPSQKPTAISDGK